MILYTFNLPDGTVWLVRQQNGQLSLIREDEYTPPPPPETTIKSVSAAVVIPSEGTAPNEVPFTASFSLTAAVWSWDDADGAPQTGTPPVIERRWALDGVTVGTSATLAAGTDTRVGQYLVYSERAQDPVTGDWTDWAFAASVGPIGRTVVPPTSLTPLSTDWGVYSGEWVDANGNPITILNPGPTDRWRFRYWLKYGATGYGDVDPSQAPPFGTQWAISGVIPAPDANFEPGTLQETLADGRRIYFSDIRDKTGQRWDLIPRPNGATTADITIRAKFEETQAWSAETTPRKAVAPPPVVVKPSAIAAWTLTAGSLDGQVTIAVAAGQPTSWGDGTAGKLQWHNTVDGWQDMASSSITVTLPTALHGTTATIQVRGYSAEGIEGIPSSKTVAVVGSVTYPEVWNSVLFQGIGVVDKGLTDGRREDYGGFDYQFEHCGDVFYNPTHAKDGQVAIWAMDVHPGFVCGNHSDPFPVVMSPEFQGIRGRHGISCKIDREQPNRHVWITRNQGGNSRGGIWTSTDYSRTISYEHTADGSGLPFIGGQGGGGSSPYRAWHRWIQQSVVNPLHWLVISRREGTSGGAIYRSIDRAQTWTAAAQVISQNNVYTLAQDAAGRMMFGSETGLHISPSFASNFAAPFWPTGIPEAARTQIIGIECHPTDDRYGYIVTWNGGCYRTHDKFVSVQSIGPAANSFCNVFASPWNFNNVWIIGLNNGGTTPRISQFSANGLAGAVGQAAGNPSWTQLVLDGRTYGWEKDVNAGDMKINAPGSNRQMQCGVVPAKHTESGHKRAHIAFKAKRGSTDNGFSFRTSSDGLDRSGAGDLNCIALDWAMNNPNVCMLGGYDNATMMSRNNFRGFYSLNMGEITTAASIAPNRPNCDWAALISGGYGGGSVRFSKNVHQVPSTAFGEVTTWRDAGVGTENHFVSFARGTDGNNTLWTSKHRCTNFDLANPTFTTLSSTSGFTADMEVVMVSAYASNVAYALRGDRYLHKTTDSGASWSQYVDFGRTMSGGGFWVDPKDHDTVIWYTDTQGLRRYTGTGSATTIDSSVIGINGNAVARRIRICPVSNTIYMLYFAMGSKRFGLLRKKGTANAQEVMRYLPRSEAVRSIDICPHTGILYQLGTVGPRYLPPPTVNALAKTRLDFYKSYKYDASATLALL